MSNKKGFFERLTGAVRLEDEEDDAVVEKASAPELARHDGRPNIFEEAEEEAQLTVDVYQTSSEIIIKTMVAGVKPDDLDVAITRDSVTVRGKRKEEHTVSEDDYYHKELYWGAFSRTISLPEEIDVDGAEAVEKHGMLILHLPKVDRGRQAKLKVRGG